VKTCNRDPIFSSDPISPLITIEAIDDYQQGLNLPVHQDNALSTAGSPQSEFQRIW